MNIYTNKQLYMYINISIDMYTHIYIPICIHICMYICIYTYIYLSIYIYIYIYIWQIRRRLVRVRLYVWSECVHASKCESVCVCNITCVGGVFVCVRERV